ncbi:unnamed protein product [Sphagnum jensenii]
MDSGIVFSSSSSSPSSFALSQRVFQPVVNPRPRIQHCHSLCSSFSGVGVSTPSTWNQIKQFSHKSRSSNKLERRRPVSHTVVVAAGDVPDFLPATWTKTRDDKPFGPSFDLTAEETALRQLNALHDNDIPYADHGVEVMYRFAGFDPFKRSEYFGPFFDLGQFERFRRIFHHSTYRVLLSHTERRVLSSLYVNEHCFKQRVWISGARPGEEEVFEFTLIQRVGGNWDGYWLTDSLRHDGNGITGGIAY